mmetsp:Transcript_2977/g.7264  ORF Transcript_2977/g.7264 Transcript_2977/m.7264 type:complete len:144 (+) Transcript_2977:138-569(+)
MTTTSSSRQPVLFLSHGAGPAFYMEDEGRWKGVGRQSAWNRFLEGYGEQIGKNVRALLVISAHWECERPTVLAREKHTLLFDYYGFPSATYQLEWEARGDLELATQLAELLGVPRWSGSGASITAYSCRSSECFHVRTFPSCS